MSRPNNIVVYETTEKKNKNKNKKYIETSNKTAIKAKDDSFIDNGLLSPFDIPPFLF